MNDVYVAVPKEAFPLELEVKTACPMANGTARISTDTVKIQDVKSGAMSINGHDFLTALFESGVNIQVIDGDTVDPGLCVNGKLVLEGCGILPILEGVIEVLKLECAAQGEYPSR